MKPKDVKKWFIAVLPIRRKSSTDWIIPSAIGLGVGIAAGIGVGMLLAPQSGQDTRRRLREGADELKHKALSLAERAKSQVSTTAHQLGNNLSRPYTSESEEMR